MKVAEATVAWDGPDATIDLAGVRRRATVAWEGDDLVVFTNGATCRLSYVSPLGEAAVEEAASGRLVAPMPGVIAAVLATAGTDVRRGAPLIVLEAMKMEHTIQASSDGTVQEVRVAVGDQVREGFELMVLRPATGGGDAPS